MDNRLIMKKITGLLGVVLLVVIDQITKFLAITHLQNKEPIIIIKDVLKLMYLENTGAVFGILKNKIVIFVIITAITLAFIGYVYYRIPESKKYRPLKIILVLLSSGAIGNLIDRVMNNYVVDFIYFELIDFPIFNIADCYVTISAVLLLLYGLFYYSEEDLAFITYKKIKKKED
jgi:signal peptidase II